MGSLTTNTLANQGAPSPATMSTLFVSYWMACLTCHSSDGHDLKQFRSEISRFPVALRAFQLGRNLFAA